MDLQIAQVKIMSKVAQSYIQLREVLQNGKTCKGHCIFILLYQEIKKKHGQASLPSHT